jgi:adenosylhomocysteine nucleosidase
LIDHYPAGWGLVICAGAAGALLDRLSVGDLVLGTETVEHDYNNKFSQHPLPSFAGDPAAIAGLQAAAADSDRFKVHVGLVASGDEDVIDGDRRAALHAATGALAVAWEGAGGARACSFSNVPFLEIRGITDSADRHAPVDFEQNLEVAMSNAALLLEAWLRMSV